MYFIVCEIVLSQPVVGRYERLPILWPGSGRVNRSAGPEQEVKCKQDALVFTVTLCVCVLKRGVVKRVKTSSI